MCAPQDENEPKSYREAFSSPAYEKWKAAMIKEMESMKKKSSLKLGRSPTWAKDY